MATCRPACPAACAEGQPWMPSRRQPFARGDTMHTIRTPALRGTALAAAPACAALAASAQQSGSLEKMKQMKVATTDLNIPLVPQTGKNADAIRANLKRVKLPPGFRIDLYAVVPD